MISQNKNFIKIKNSETVNFSAIPSFVPKEFSETIKTFCNDGLSIASYFAFINKNSKIQLLALFADRHNSNLIPITTELCENRIQSLASEYPQLQLFEREIAEQFGAIFDGHPRFYPLRFHSSYTGNDAWNRTSEIEIKPAVIPFPPVEGDDIHEVAVGPVHAGVIEPGHFRFQCYGETVFNLQISLGYQHRGIEKILIGCPDKKTIHLIETAAGDSTIAHTTAYSQIIETLYECNKLSPQSLSARAVLLELERMANHTGDIGALANDVAFLPTSSYCGRIRGDFLNMIADFCGNRFGRRAIIPGGIRYSLNRNRIENLKSKFKKSFDDLNLAAELLFNTSSAVERFEECGVLTKQTAQSLGIVGLAARASGIPIDARFDFPSGIYNYNQIPVVTLDTSDVYARALIRWLEAKNSAQFILNQLDFLSEGNFSSDKELNGTPKPDSFIASIVEGWRGEVVHTAITDSNGRFLRYKIVDPSFHNWNGLEAVLKNESIFNFPLCNKSFNLSYCGYDL